MEELKRYQQLIESMLERNRFAGNPQSLYDPLNYLLDLGGKRLRPMLTLIACEMMHGDPGKAIMPALGIEVFHNFTLMHDDIMDEAPLRRGQATVHKKWNTATAILSGDLMLVKAYEWMMKSEGLARIKVLELFTKTAAEVCEGQQMDMEFESRTVVTVADYMKIIEIKTAVLLGCSLKTGAFIAQADESDADLLYDFGIYTGIGFQLMDDILDVFGDAEKVGKQEAGDILSDKKTFLLLEAYARANAQQKAELNKWIGHKAINPEDKVKAVKAVYAELEIEKLARQKAEEYFVKADRLLEAVKVESTRKQVLRNYAEYLKNRIS
ncbi:MAG: polyprenyl synthetase family protein [Bacteroidota bacterium]|nr:polyprenyl synthetase family protein [Bacteroidota bacterium]MDX5430028.1 polyprenyl synthetase family protein [Bacteroidota bacterium]MDX5468798.1 polyprenyl synthetase family protein [Bacteroidota bacterium]